MLLETSGSLWSPGSGLLGTDTAGCIKSQRPLTFDIKADRFSSLTQKSSSLPPSYLLLSHMSGA